MKISADLNVQTDVASELPSPAVIDCIWLDIRNAATGVAPTHEKASA